MTSIIPNMTATNECGINVAASNPSNIEDTAATNKLKKKANPINRVILIVFTL